MSGLSEVLRRGLWPLSLLYAAATALRNAGYTHGALAVHRLGVPVISVGNLTVGGTGKTPMVVWLIEQALALGRRPGVLARGYGRVDGAALNDEGQLLAARFPGLSQVQDPDRVAGGERLCADHAVDVIVLDDGFQHRRLHRDCDVVCVDAARPFDGGFVLPAGDLREVPSGLRRADVVVLTRAGHLDEAARRERVAQMRRTAGRDLPVFFAEHAPLDVLDTATAQIRPPGWLAERRVVLLSAIARPRAFEDTVRSLGAEVVDHAIRRDHHAHDPAAVRLLVEGARAQGAELLTTEKDAVKLHQVDAPVQVLRVGLRFLDGAPAPAEVGLR